MKNLSQFSLVIALALGGIGAAKASPVVANTSSAVVLANSVAGHGISISNAVFSTDALVHTGPAGTFAGGVASFGFDSGVVLTNGTTGCVAGPNASNCSGYDTTYSSLAFDFVSTTGQVFFNYVFASEEYHEFVSSNFNDYFELLLNGRNVAMLPSMQEVSINSVNCDNNPSFYRNNDSLASCANLGLDTGFDGLTTVLSVSASLNAGLNHFEFIVWDRGDDAIDSAVFIQAGSFRATPPNGVPEPGTLVLMGAALVVLVVRRRSLA